MLPKVHSYRDFTPHQTPKLAGTSLNTPGPSVNREQFFCFIGRTQARPNGEYCKRLNLSDAENDTRRKSPVFRTLDEMWTWVNQNTKYWWRVSFMGGGQEHIQLPGDPEPLDLHNYDPHWSTWNTASTYREMKKALGERMYQMARAHDQEMKYQRNRRSRF